MAKTKEEQLERDKCTKYQFRVNEKDFDTDEEYLEFLEFVTAQKKRKKSADFFRAAVLDRYKLQKEASEDDIDLLFNYIQRYGLKQIIENLENAKANEKALEQITKMLSVNNNEQAAAIQQTTEVIEVKKKKEEEVEVGIEDADDAISNLLG